MTAIGEVRSIQSDVPWRSRTSTVAISGAVIALFAYDLFVFFELPSAGQASRWTLYGVVPAVFLFCVFLFLTRGRRRGVGSWFGIIALSVALPCAAFLFAICVGIPITLVRTLFPAGEWTQHCQRDNGVAHCSIYRAERVEDWVVGVSVWLSGNAPPKTEIYYMGDRLDHVSIRFSKDTDFSELHCASESAVWTCPFPNAGGLFAENGTTAVWVKIEHSGTSEVQKFGFPNMRKHVKDARRMMPDLRLQ